MRIGNYQIAFFGDSKYKKIAITLFILAVLAIGWKVIDVATCTNCLYRGI